MKGLKAQLGDHKVQMQPLSVDQLRSIYQKETEHSGLL